MKIFVFALFQLSFLMKTWLTFQQWSAKTSQDKTCYTFPAFWNVMKDHFNAKDLDEFMKRKKLGEGSFGKVYESGNQRYQSVFKYVPFVNNFVSKTFDLETKYMTYASKNPNLINIAVRLISCAKSETAGGILMERMGPSMASMRQEIINLPHSHRIKIYRDIAISIGKLHEVGICHNDIKAENLLLVLGSYYLFKIADFGLSCSLNQLCQGGTPFYDAPEKKFLMNNKFKCTRKIDEWAWLITVSEIEIGTQLNNFNGDCTKNTDACIQKKKSIIQSFSRNKSNDFLNSVLKGLESSPHTRLSMENIVKNISKQL